MPRHFWLALLLLAGQPGQLLTLEIQVFRGSEVVTTQSRVTVYRGGDRTKPVAQPQRGQSAKMQVPAGIYDAQAVLEQDARVVSIRWAERLVVMPYPDEGGHHLEVINLTPGYGALQVRTSAGAQVENIALFAPTDRSQPIASSPGQSPYALFVVRAGPYDIQIRRGTRTAWHQNVEIPLDRTRLWIVP